MTVVKSKRTKSSIDFEMNYLQVAEWIDTLVSHNFYAKGDMLETNKTILEVRGRSLEELTDELLRNIKIANSIYPTCKAEYEERRVTIGHAIGDCFAILTHLQRIMIRLRIADNRYTEPIRVIGKMINSLKAWRKSDNKFKREFDNNNND